MSRDEPYGSAARLPSGEDKREEEKKGKTKDEMPEMPQSEHGFAGPDPEERDVPLQRESRRRKREEEEGRE